MQILGCGLGVSTVHVCAVRDSSGLQQIWVVAQLAQRCDDAQRVRAAVARRAGASEQAADRLAVEDVAVQLDLGVGGVMTGRIKRCGTSALCIGTHKWHAHRVAGPTATGQHN